MDVDDNWLPLTVEAAALYGAAHLGNVRMKRLPFYKETVLVRTAEGAAHFLARPGVLTPLDGSSIPIHEANALEPVDLHDGNVLDYLDFFCAFVQGDEGPFHLLTDMGELFDFQAIDERARAALAGTIRPPSLVERDEDDGSFLCEAFVIYGGAVFAARFSISSHGMVKMLTNDPFRGLYERN
jgi:hypothetical protein